MATFDRLIKTKTYVNILKLGSLKLHLMNTCSKLDAIVSNFFFFFGGGGEESKFRFH